MPAPTEPPIGLVLAQTAKAVERAFDDALSAAGSSRPNWLILMALRTQQPRTQTDLAAVVGIKEATLSYHLGAMEADGLIGRSRDPGNRRVHQVTLTAAGEALFRQLVEVARAHDRRLRTGLSSTDVEQLRGILERLRGNVSADAR